MIDLWWQISKMHVSQNKPAFLL